MEALFASLVSKYGFEYAAKMLGLDKQTENPKYAISLGNFSFDPVNAAKRAVLNTGIRSALGGKLSGIMGPIGLIGGALMLGRAFDPTRPGSRNYNPNLAAQMADLNRRGMLNSRGQIISGPLAGKNLISMFGTNDYEEMLDNKVDYFEDRIKAGKPISEKNYREAKNEQIETKGIGVNIDGVTMSGADYQGEVDNTGSSTKGGSKSSSRGSGFDSSERGAALHRAKGGLARYYKGGIASL